jgi:hypothetical protein
MFANNAAVLSKAAANFRDSYQKLDNPIEVEKAVLSTIADSLGGVAERVGIAEEERDIKNPATARALAKRYDQCVTFYETVEAELKKPLQHPATRLQPRPLPEPPPPEPDLPEEPEQPASPKPEQLTASRAFDRMLAQVPKMLPWKKEIYSALNDQIFGDNEPLKVRLLGDRAGQIYPGKTPNGAALIKLLRTVPELDVIFAVDPSTGDPSLSYHAQKVLRMYNFLKTTYSNVLKTVDRKNPDLYIDFFMPLYLSLHDVGKPKSLSDGGSQYERNAVLMAKLMEYWELNKSQISLATALVEHDIVGTYVKEFAKGKNPSVEKAVADLENQFRRSGMPELSQFWYLQKLFYLCDSLSYDYVRTEFFRFVEEGPNGGFFVHDAGGLERLEAEIAKKFGRDSLAAPEGKRPSVKISKPATPISPPPSDKSWWWPFF